MLGLVALYARTTIHEPIDAETFANFIGIAPQVDGPLIHLNVRDTSL